MIHDFWKIDLRRGTTDSKVRCIFQTCCFFCGGYQRLGRNTAVVEAIPTHLAAFDKNCFRTHLARARSNGKTTRSPPYYTNIRLYLFCHGAKSCPYIFCLRSFFITTGKRAMTPNAQKERIISGVTRDVILKSRTQSVRPASTHA